MEVTNVEVDESTGVWHVTTIPYTLHEILITFGGSSFTATATRKHTGTMHTHGHLRKEAINFIASIELQHRTYGNFVMGEAK